MNNIIKGNKIYTLGGEKKEEYKLETNEELIEMIIEIPAVTMKGHRDELIEMDSQANPPIFKWKKEFLNTFDNMSLRMLLRFAERRKIRETKRY